MSGRRHIRMMVPLGLLACVACTDRGVVGPETEYFSLVGGMVMEPQGAARQVASCPPIDSVRVATKRQAIPGSSASILVPVGSRSAAFPGARGIAIQVPRAGMLGVSYDDILMRPVGPNNGRFRFPDLANGLASDSWCRITVGGRDAVLFISSSFESAVEVDPRTIPFGPVAVIATTTPTGRRVNVMLVTADGYGVIDPPPVAGEESVALRRLLTFVGTIQW